MSLGQRMRQFYRHLAGRGVSPFQNSCCYLLDRTVFNYLFVGWLWDVRFSAHCGASVMEGELHRAQALPSCPLEMSRQGLLGN